MITVWDACVLGVVQGLTEFLPVSSSGHLAVLHQLIAPLPATETAAIDVALHAGTLAATLLYFHRDLLAMLAALRAPAAGGWHGRWIWLLALASVPAAVVGGLWRHQIEAMFTSLPFVGVSFLVTGTLLFVAGRMPHTTRDEADVNARDALVVGTFQSAALLPGISRSGFTIAGGLLSGLRGDVAARFSFLLGLPAVAGAELVEVRTVLTLDTSEVRAVVVGAFVAGMTGLVAIRWLLRLLGAKRLHYFSYYLWSLGILVLAGSWGRGG
jgi:undecaprenyl-diphosphatase